MMHSTSYRLFMSNKLGTKRVHNLTFLHCNTSLYMTSSIYCNFMIIFMFS